MVFTKCLDYEVVVEFAVDRAVIAVNVSATGVGFCQGLVALVLNLRKTCSRFSLLLLKLC